METFRRQAFNKAMPRWLIIGTLLLSSTCVETIAADLTDGSGRFFEEVVHEFRTMKQTSYQHKTEVDRTSGTYRYDCVGFVSYALRQASPKAWASVVTACGIRKGYFPSPPRYQGFFASLEQHPQPGWRSVAKVADLLPGDIVSWDHKTQSAVGHAVVIAGRPRHEGAGVWIVEVYDSTAAPHLEDSRPGDERAQPTEAGGKPSGLGRGTMALIADPVSGALIGHRWSPKGKTVIAPTAAGRPTS